MVIDEDAIQGQVRDVLPDERYEVVGSNDLKEAIELLRSCSPNVVFIDAAKARRRLDGTIADPFTAWLVLRGLRTALDSWHTEVLRSLLTEVCMRRHINTHQADLHSLTEVRLRRRFFCVSLTQSRG